MKQGTRNLPARVQWRERKHWLPSWTVSRGTVGGRWGHCIWLCWRSYQAANRPWIKRERERDKRNKIWVVIAIENVLQNASTVYMVSQVAPTHILKVSIFYFCCRKNNICVCVKRMNNKDQTDSIIIKNKRCQTVQKASGRHKLHCLCCSGVRGTAMD